MTASLATAFIHRSPFPAPGPAGCASHRRGRAAEGLDYLCFVLRLCHKGGYVIPCRVFFETEGSAGASFVVYAPGRSAGPPLSWGGGRSLWVRSNAGKQMTQTLKRGFEKVDSSHKGGVGASPIGSWESGRDVCDDFILCLGEPRMDRLNFPFRRSNNKPVFRAMIHTFLSGPLFVSQNASVGS